MSAPGNIEAWLKAILASDRRPDARADQQQGVTVRRARFGTKGYAMKIMHELMREWAREERKDSSSRAAYFVFNQVLGARRALRSVGALTEEQYDKVRARTQRIIRAKVIRRSEVRRAA